MRCCVVRSKNVQSLFTTQSDQSSLSASLSEPPSPIPRRSFIILSMSIALPDRGGGAVLARARCTV